MAIDKNRNGISVLIILLTFAFFSVASINSVFHKNKYGEASELQLGFSSNTSVNFGVVELSEHGGNNYFSEYFADASKFLFITFIILITSSACCLALGRNVYLITAFSQAP